MRLPAEQEITKRPQWMEYRHSSECAYLVLQLTYKGILPKLKLWYPVFYAMALFHRQRIVEDNMGLVFSTIGKLQVKKEQIPQLESQGIVKLIYAVEKFEPLKGNKFSSFATPYIKFGALQWQRDHPPITIPRKEYELWSKAKQVRERLIEKNGSASIQEIAVVCGVTPQQITAAGNAFKLHVPCAIPRDDDGNEFDVADHRQTTSFDSAQASDAERDKQIYDACSTVWRSHLPYQHKKILISHSIEGVSIQRLSKRHKLSVEEIESIINTSLEYFRNADNRRRCTANNAVQLRRSSRVEATVCS